MAENVKGEKKPNPFGKFFRELRAEFKKIVWPSKKTVISQSAVVLVAVIAMGLIVAGFDFVLIKGVQWFIGLF